jgi:branched-chain amino acid aminotransferase
MAMLISINGKFVDEKQACISVTSNAFLYGQAVFETIRTFNRKVFRLDDHLGRLYISADVMEIKPKWTLKKTYAEVVKVLEKTTWLNIKVRVILTKTDLIIIAEKLNEKPKDMYEKGVALVSFPGKRNMPRAKNLASAFTYAAKQHATRSGAYEAILIDSKGYVRECAYANIFWVQDGELYTTNKDILFGITRETVIDLVGKCNFTGIKLKSLVSADEVFITQTTSGIIPVVKIDGQPIGSGRPGKVTKEIMKKFSDLVWGK